MTKLLTQAILVVTSSALLCESTHSFITLGDWGGMALGGYHSIDVKDVAAQMGRTAASSDINFLVNVGDNFYYCGIQNTSDFQLKEDYLSIYTAQSLQVPWYSALGNHEYAYNVDAQLEFTQVDPSGRWYLPSRYYTKRINLAAGQYLTFIVLDTNPCISSYRSSDPSGWDPCGTDFPTCAPIEEGPCNFHKNIMSQDCSLQFTWLKTQLKQVPKDDWLIIVGHHPLDEIDVEDFPSEILRHGFDLYLNGHVHTLQQYKVDGNSAFVTSGAGAMVKTADQDHDIRGSAASHTYGNVWEEKVAGFTLHTFSEDFKRLKTDFLSYEGQILHSFTVTKGSSPPGPTPSPSPHPAPTCGGAGSYPCKPGCTYIHKANEGVCQVRDYGCYNCSRLPSDCPDCNKVPSPSFGLRCSSSAGPCEKGCTYVQQANEAVCGVARYGCYDCANLLASCLDCHGVVV